MSGAAGVRTLQVELVGVDLRPAGEVGEQVDRLRGGFRLLSGRAGLSFRRYGRRGGKLSIDSGPGEGAEVAVTLPMVRADKSQLAP